MADYPKEFKKKRKTVCVQGLGFVGAAMSLAVADASDSNGEPLYNVIGIDIPNEAGVHKAETINKGRFPYESVDLQLKCAQDRAHQRKNLWATTEADYFKYADVVIVDINLDVQYHEDGSPYMDLSGFKSAMYTIGSLIHAGTLIIVETTVPPGTCEKVVYPIICEEFERRGIAAGEVRIAHSYERVMPGSQYFDSIVNFWRVYSGIDAQSSKMCYQFLKSVIHTDKYPLTELKSTTASETAKVLENSYRAATIAFAEEWGRFAEAVGIDLFEVIDAIRMRPTHSNMRQPGFGVGGYCLTKDPLFAKLAARDLYGREDLKFPFCTNAVKVNKQMPLVSLEKIQDYYSGDIMDKKILLLGISYRQDVGDTRYSPSEVFARAAIDAGAQVIGYDPLVKNWDECEKLKGLKVLDERPVFDNYDVVVFAVPHEEFVNLDKSVYFTKKKMLYVDSNHVLSDVYCDLIMKNGNALICIGKGIRGE